MSKDLTVLGAQLCLEFDDQQKELKKLGFEVQVDIRKQRGELKKLGFEVQVDIRKQRGELYHQKKIDVSERQAEKLRLQTEVKTLLISYGDESRPLRQIQNRELKSWREELRNDLEGWQKAVQYIHRKC